MKLAKLISRHLFHIRCVYVRSLKAYSDLTRTVQGAISFRNAPKTFSNYDGDRPKSWKGGTVLYLVVVKTEYYSHPKLQLLFVLWHVMALRRFSVMCGSEIGDRPEQTGEAFKKKHHGSTEKHIGIKKQTGIKKASTRTETEKFRGGRGHSNSMPFLGIPRIRSRRGKSHSNVAYAHLL